MLPDFDIETAKNIVESEYDHIHYTLSWWAAWDYLHKDLPEDEKFAKRIETMANSPLLHEVGIAAVAIKGIKRMEKQ